MDEEQNQTSKAHNVGQQPKQTFWLKKYWLVLLATAFILVSAGVVFATINLSGSSNERNLNKSALNQQQETNQEIDTSDWKTYQNEEYGFEFKYPNAFSVDENRNHPASGDIISSFRRLDRPGDPFPFYGDWSFNVSGPGYNAGSFEESIEEYKGVMENKEDFKEAQINVADRLATKFSYVAEDSRNKKQVKYVDTFIPTENSFVQIGWKSQEHISENETAINKIKSLNKILSSFEFVDTNLDHKQNPTSHQFDSLFKSDEGIFVSTEDGDYFEFDDNRRPVNIRSGSEHSYEREGATYRVNTPGGNTHIFDLESGDVFTFSDNKKNISSERNYVDISSGDAGCTAVARYYLNAETNKINIASASECAFDADEDYKIPDYKISLNEVEPLFPTKKLTYQNLDDYKWSYGLSKKEFETFFKNQLASDDEGGSGEVQKIDEGHYRLIPESSSSATMNYYLEPHNIRKGDLGNDGDEDTVAVFKRCRSYCIRSGVIVIENINNTHQVVSTEVYYNSPPYELTGGEIANFFIDRGGDLTIRYDSSRENKKFTIKNINGKRFLVDKVD